MTGAGCKDRTHSLLKCMPTGPGKQPKDYIKELFSDNGKDHMREYFSDKRNRISMLHK